MYWDHKKFFALFVSKLSHCSDCPCKSEAPHWIALYLLTLLHSFIWHMFLITGKTRPGLRRKIVVKQNLMKSLIKPRGGLIRWLVTCSSSSQISSHCSLDPVEMEATRSVYRLFAWYLMSIRNTQAGPQWPPWPSQPARRQWEVRFRKLATASPAIRAGEIREISCVIREEAGGQQK